MRFPVGHAVPLLNHGTPEGLREMTFAGARRAEKEDVGALRHEAAGRELVHEGPVHLLVEIKVKAVQRAIGIAEACLEMSAFEEPILSPYQLVADERRHQIDSARAAAAC